MSNQLRVAVIGDNFVGTDLFADALRRHLEPAAGPVELATMSVPWPDTPLLANEEVKEFLGDPVEVARLAQDAEVLLTHVAPVTQQVFDAAPALRIVGCCRGGPVNVNVAAAHAALSGRRCWPTRWPRLSSWPRAANMGRAAL